MFYARKGAARRTGAPRVDFQGEGCGAARVAADKARSMLAKDLMTTDVVVVRPDTPAQDIARVLLDHAISAVPVVDGAGAPIGMVSEGDLIGRDDAQRDARRDWWLALVAEGEALGKEFLSSLGARKETASDIMVAPVITVDDTTEDLEIARLLRTYRIKRLPVVRDGRVVGIVSRADLLKALTAERLGAPPARAPGFFTGVVDSFDRTFHHHGHAGVGGAPAPVAADDALNAADLRGLVADFKHGRSGRDEQERRAAAEQRKVRVRALIDHHIDDAKWRGMLQQARAAAERGEKQMLLLRFPSQLCSDGGRAINIAEPDWPKSLRGEAAELYLRWEHDLKPRGFHLTAQVLEFPGGVPGDIGLFLVWGE